jgi:SAM-dependent methyltransferase
MDPNEYTKLADVEDRMWYFRALHAHAHRLLAHGLAGRDAPRILDAGCGTGGLIVRLQRREPAWRFSGIDFSPLACAFAAKRCREAEIREASVTALPFKEGNFDAVVSGDVLCQIEKPEEAMAEFYRCLRPGGIAVINVPAYRWLWSYHDEMVQSKHRFDRREVVELAERAGLRVESSTYWNTLPFPLVVARRKLVRRRPAGGDVRMYPVPVEAMFNVMMAAERAWLRNVGRLPYGSSVLIAARRVTGN